MRAWQFKQKTPGFGISRNFYLSVLSGTAVLPSVDEVVRPNPIGPIVEGFGVPLSSGATKDDLQRPMQRGAYALSTKDRKSVLKMLVLPKEEAGFDPGPLLRSSFAQALTPETKDRISATWSLFQLTFETHHPMVYDSVRFILRIAQRLAHLTEGVVADPLAQAYRLPNEVFHNPQADPRIDARDVVSVHRRDTSYMYTAGLQKFSLPEVEIGDISLEMVPAASSLLYSLSQKVLTGNLIGVGDRIGSRSLPLTVAVGGLDRAQWEGISVFELIPPTGKTSADALAAHLSDS